jgi:hypothetical protein
MGEIGCTEEQAVIEKTYPLKFLSGVFPFLPRWADQPGVNPETIPKYLLELVER